MKQLTLFLAIVFLLASCSIKSIDNQSNPRCKANGYCAGHYGKGYCMDNRK